MPVVTIILGLLDLAQRALPLIDQLKLSGQFTAEDQQKISDAYKKFHDAGSQMFSQDHWKID